MRQLSIIRLAILIFMRDLLIPGGGLFLAIWLPTHHQLEPWHLPLIAGMLGTPLVARGGVPSEDDRVKEIPTRTEAAPATEE